MKMEMKIEKIKAIISVISAVVLVTLITTFAKTNQPQYTTDTVIVAHGDTLWSIASDYCPNSIDKRQYIENIQTDSGCNVDIHPGDVLTVRVYEE